MSHHILRPVGSVTAITSLLLLGVVNLGCQTTEGDVAGADDSAFTESGDNGGACVAENEGHSEAKPHFDYDDDGEHGPERWDDLLDKDGKVAFPSCDPDKTGQQSPIALPAPGATKDGGFVAASADDAFGLGPKTLTWSKQTTIASLFNNGHTWQANIGDSANVLVDGSAKFKLGQFHFHAPSEHTIDGKRFPLEAHFVHTADNVPPESGTAESDTHPPFAAVVAVMFEEDGRDNPELAKIWPRFKACKQASPSKLEDVQLDLTALLPKDRTHLQYDGSLTTPPCSRKVRFRVLTTTVRASRAQIEAFQKVWPDNSRPTQRLLPTTKITLHTP